MRTFLGVFPITDLIDEASAVNNSKEIDFLIEPLSEIPSSSALRDRKSGAINCGVGLKPCNMQ